MLGRIELKMAPCLIAAFVLATGAHVGRAQTAQQPGRSQNLICTDSVVT
jgi:hypothetical protein